MILPHAAIAGVFATFVMFVVLRPRQPRSWRAPEPLHRRGRSWFITSMAGALLATALTAATTVVGVPAAEAVPPPWDPGWTDGKIAYSVSYSMSTQSIGAVDADGSNPTGIGGSMWVSAWPS